MKTADCATAHNENDRPPQGCESPAAAGSAPAGRAETGGRLYIRKEEPAAPTVSVIVPNYNHLRFLKTRIDSILAQTFTDYEIILLDDCSTDGSRRFLLQYRDHPAVSRIVLNGRNSGSPFMQWEKGIRLARGKYVWIAESDDSALPDFLRRTVEELEAHPEAQLCITGSEIIDAEGRSRERNKFERWEPDGTTHIYPSYEYLVQYMVNRNSVYNASMALFRRKNCLKGICPDYLRMRYCGDWFFWIEQIRKGSLVEIRERLNRFRQHTNNTTAETASDLRAWGEVVYVKKLLHTRVIREKWRILRDKYDAYRTVKRWASSADERARLLELLAREDDISFRHYLLWKLYYFYRKISGRPVPKVG